MTNLHAVPVIVPISETEMNNGSAFTFFGHGRDWLLTAGHLPLLMRTPHKNWDEWPSRIVCPNFNLSLFSEARMRVPRFAYLDCGEHIADIIALPLSPVEGHVMRKRFKCFEDCPPPILGEHASAYGFVRIGTELSSEQVTPLAVCEVTNELIGFQPNCKEGFSGGPIVGESGHLIGMTIGHDDGLGRAVSVKAIMHCLESNLHIMRP